jgi:DNA-binding response OmpR family regulator
MAAPACLQRTYGDVVIDRVSLIVTCAGRQVSLTPTELRLRWCCPVRRGWCSSWEQLLEAVWDVG